ncbi:hypothetical protein ACT3RL_08980 [Halomonas sp. AOP5-CZ2-32]
MQSKALGLTSLLALLSAPAIAQDNAVSAQQAPEFESKALEQYEAECRSLYHQTWYVFDFRFDYEGTEEEARELFLSENYVNGSVMDSEGLESLINAAYVELADIQPNTSSSDHLSKEIALNSYAFCLGLIDP